MKTKTASDPGIVFGSKEFWELYDRFCTKENLSKLIEGPESPLDRQMQAVTRAAHLTRTIHNLSRPDRGWKHHHTLLTLRCENVQRHDGEFGMDMRAGDVIVVEHGWDRDVPITHSPIERRITCGYLLSGKWEPMIGLFLPLFDKKTILCAIELRIAKNVKDAMELAHQESSDWGWY